ncbi:MAG: hypothetical protein J6H31_03220 [Butyrivibrio sp.]|nr:hypothetical protein [Butyrivibrio sp.]
MKTSIKSKLLLVLFLLISIDCLTSYAENYSDESARKAIEVLLPIITPDMTDYDKAVAAHDWLCTNCEGDSSSYESKDYMPYDFSADGPLLYGTSLCKGYAEAFRLFMNILQIENRIVQGYVRDGYHAWNEVKIDGKWYAVDVTFDDPILVEYDSRSSKKRVIESYRVYSRKYCMIDPEEMNNDRLVCEYLY